MKILVLVDGSPCSAKAIEYIARQLDCFQGQDGLHVLHVHPKVPGGLSRSIVGIDAIHTYYAEESRAALESSEKILNERGIQYQSGYKVGRVEEEVQEYVTEHGIEMIVMGSHGHGAIKGLVMGSFATRVLTTATVPVLIVR